MTMSIPFVHVDFFVPKCSSLYYFNTTRDVLNLVENCINYRTQLVQEWLWIHQPPQKISLSQRDGKALNLFISKEKTTTPPGNGYISHQTGSSENHLPKCHFFGDMLVPWRVPHKPYISKREAFRITWGEFEKSEVSQEKSPRKKYESRVNTSPSAIC